MDGRVVGDDVLGPVAGHDGDELAFADTQVLEACGCLVHGLAVFAPGQRLPVPILVVDRGLVTVTLRIPIEVIDDCLAFYLGVDLRSLRQHGFLGHFSSAIRPLLRPGGAYLSRFRYSRGSSARNLCLFRGNQGLLDEATGCAENLGPGAGWVTPSTSMNTSRALLWR